LLKELKMWKVEGYRRIYKLVFSLKNMKMRYKKNLVLIVLIGVFLVGMILINIFSVNADWIYITPKQGCCDNDNSCCNANDNCLSSSDGTKDCDTICSEAGKNPPVVDVNGRTCRSGELDPCPYWAGNYLGGDEIIENIDGYYYCYSNLPLDNDKADRVLACHCGNPQISVDGLIAWWKFDDNPNDGVHEENYIYHGDCTDSTCPDLVIDGGSGGVGDGSYDFDGNNEYVNVNNLNTDAYAISFWINPIKEINKNYGYEVVLGYDLVNPDDEDRIIFGDATSYIDGETLTIADGDSRGPYYRTGIKENIAVGWHLIILNWDSIEGKYDIYIDKNKEITSPASGGSGSGGDAHLISFNSEDIFSIGADPIISSKGFKGQIDNVMIYNKALTETEISDIYNFQSSGYGPEICNNDEDDDNDDKVDCDDDDCIGDPACAKCSSDQVIMKLASSDNSHGTNLLNDPDYNYNICYDVIFEEKYVFDDIAKLRECSGTNKVLRLSGTTNAHAEEPYPVTPDSAYSQEICYGNLNCHVVDLSSEDCEADEKIVVKLSSLSNAHISDASGDYNHAVCCKSYSVTGPRWENMHDEGIDDADLDDLVKLVVPGTGLTQKIEYTIYKDGGILGGLIWFWDLKVAQFETRGFTTWIAGKKEADGSLNPGDYYFKAKVNNKEYSSEDSPTNGILTVSDEEDNTAPVAIITSPETRQIYFLNEELNFTHESYDVDDEYNYIWDLGNGVEKTGNSLNFANKSFLYTYDSQEDVGQKDIILTVEDYRGLVSRSKISVLILNKSLTLEPGSETASEKYVLAYINEPELDSDEGRKVWFDSGGSYVIEYKVEKDPVTEAITRSVNCLSGNCTLNTEGCYPTTDPAPIFPDCQIVVDNPPGDPILYPKMDFSWVFDDDPSSKQPGISFDRYFPSVKRYKTNLSIKFSADSESFISSTISFFNVYFEEPVCFVVEDELDLEFISGSQIGDSYWVAASEITNTLLEGGCNNEHGITPEGDAYTKCCPLYYSCNSEDNCVYTGDYKCQDLGVDDCDGNKEEAKNEIDNIVSEEFERGCDYSVPYGPKCEEYVSCYCEWDDNDEVCRAVADHRVMDKERAPYTSWDYDTMTLDNKEFCESKKIYETGKCTYTIDYTGDCLEGDDYVLRSWSGFWDGPEPEDPNDPNYGRKEECQASDSDTISCEHVVKLSFFSWFNVVIVILSLIIIYGVILKRKEC